MNARKFSPNFSTTVLVYVASLTSVLGQSFFFGAQQLYSGKEYSGSGKMAVGDFSSDGIPDLVAGASDSNLRLLIGTGDGKLRVEGSPLLAKAVVDDIVVGDVNRDGKPDLVVTYRPSGFSVFLGDGTGKFPKRLDEQLPWSGYNALADMNGDGNLDLVYTSFTTLGVFLGKGDGTFTRRLEVRTGQVTQSRPKIFDLNGDGKLDVVVNSENGILSLLLGAGDGTLRLSTTLEVGRTGVSAEFSAGDFNGDGKTDLAILKGYSSTPRYVIGVLLGTGTGGFQPVVNYTLSPEGVELEPFCFDIGDLDGDGKLDLVAAVWVSNFPYVFTPERWISILVGKGDGSFSLVSNRVDKSMPAFPRTLTLADFNRDGKPDIAFSFSVAGEPAESGVGVYTNESRSVKAFGLVNAASYAGGAIAPGELVILYGSNLGPAKPEGVQLTPGGLATTSLSNTQVLFNGAAAPVYYTSKDSVYVFVPYAVGGQGRTAQVQAVFNGEQSHPFSVPVAESAPGLFTADSSGKGQAVIVNSDDASLNSAARPARKGSIVTLYATGEGQTNPYGLDGKVSSTLPLPTPLLPVVVGIDNAGAEILYAGGAGGLLAGVMQINFRVPADAPSGPAIPIIVKVGDAFSQSGVTLAIQ